MIVVGGAGGVKTYEIFCRLGNGICAHYRPALPEGNTGLVKVSNNSTGEMEKSDIVQSNLPCRRD